MRVEVGLDVFGLGPESLVDTDLGPTLHSGTRGGKFLLESRHLVGQLVSVDRNAAGVCSQLFKLLVLPADDLARGVEFLLDLPDQCQVGFHLSLGVACALGLSLDGDSVCNLEVVYKLFLPGDENCI